MCRTYERFKLSPSLPTRKLTGTGGSELFQKSKWGWNVWIDYVSGLDNYRGITNLEVNPEHYTVPPWESTNAMKFTYSSNKEEAEQRETELPAHETYMTDSAAAVVMVNGSKMRLLGYKIPVASYRAEQIAVKLALGNLVQVAGDEHESLTATTHLLTDSMSVMQALGQGPYKQRSPKLAMKLGKKGIQVPAHRNVRYNEVADQLAKFAAGLKEDPPHEDVIIKQLPTQLDMGTLMTFHKQGKRENWIGYQH